MLGMDKSFVVCLSEKNNLLFEIGPNSTKILNSQDYTNRTSRDYRRSKTTHVSLNYKHLTNRDSELTHFISPVRPAECLLRFALFCYHQDFFSFLLYLSSQTSLIEAYLFGLLLGVFVVYITFEHVGSTYHLFKKHNPAIFSALRADINKIKSSQQGVSSCITPICHILL